MSRGHVTSKASSFPFLSNLEPASNRPFVRKRAPWLRIEGVDQSGLGFARISTAKFCAVVAVLTVSASLFAHILL